MKIFKHKLVLGEFIRFIFVGLSVTALTYIVYLGLLPVLHYQASYAIAYILGIIYSYFVNSKFTFKQKPTVKKFVIYPIIYLVQYLVCATLLYLFVTTLGMNKKFAPLLVIALTVPLTFVLARYIIGSDNKM